jgi:hypothetical protein
MINVTQQGAANPNHVVLKGQTTISFRAQSDKPGGETATVTYNLGEPSNVVFAGGDTRHTTKKTFPSSNTVITEEVTLEWRDPSQRQPLQVTITIRIAPHDVNSLPTGTTATLMVG